MSMFGRSETSSCGTICPAFMREPIGRRSSCASCDAAPSSATSCTDQKIEFLPADLTGRLHSGASLRHSAVSADFERHLPDMFELGDKLVPRLAGVKAERRTGHDDVSGIKRE